MAGEVVALLVGAGLVGRDDVDLVLNRAGARQGLPVAQAAGRPGGGQEEYGDVLEREFADELGEAHVVADGDAAEHAVEAEGHHVFACSEILALAARREQVRLVIRGDFCARAVEDVAGIVDLAFAPVGDRAADDVHAVRARELGEHRARLLAVEVRVHGDRLRVEAEPPELGQHEHVGLCAHGLCDHAAQRLDIIIGPGESDRHLQNRDFH